MTLLGFKGQNHPQQVGARGASDEVDDRGTHPDHFDPLDARFGGFTLDVAAAPHNAKCARRGVEVGMIFAQLEHTDTRSFTVHWDNAEMAMRLGESFGLRAACDAIDNSWMHVWFEEADDE